MIGGACFLLLLLGLELGNLGFQFRNLLLELFCQFLQLLFAESAGRLPSVLQALQLFFQLLQLLFQAGDLAVDVGTVCADGAGGECGGSGEAAYHRGILSR
jgi:hypothetical protein